MKVSGTYKGGEVKSRVASEKIGDISNDITLPLQLTPEIQVTEMDIEYINYGSYNRSGVMKLGWIAKFENTSTKEVRADLNVCKSSNAAVKVLSSDQNNQYYLVDCSTISQLFKPNSETSQYRTFATSEIWTSLGKEIRLCIESVGCKQFTLNSR